MLFKTMDNKLERLQGFFITEKNIENVLDKITECEKPEKIVNTSNIFDLTYLSERRKEKDLIKKLFKDELTEEVLKFAIENGSISQNWISREFDKTKAINTNRAKAIYKEIENLNIIGTGAGNRPKPMLLNSIEEWEEMKAEIMDSLNSHHNNT